MLATAFRKGLEPPRAVEHKRVAAICLAVLISGCAENELLSPYATPGKFDFLDCPSIIGRLKESADREQQLAELMRRTNEGTGGFIVNAITYQDQINTVRANIRELRKAAEAKQCTIEAPLKR
jgi:hypothetical protein